MRGEGVKQNDRGVQLIAGCRNISYQRKKPDNPNPVYRIAITITAMSIFKRNPPQTGTSSPSEAFRRPSDGMAGDVWSAVLAT